MTTHTIKTNKPNTAIRIPSPFELKHVELVVRDGLGNDAWLDGVDENDGLDGLDTDARRDTMVEAMFG